MMSRASSQEIWVKRPSPLAPTRFSGWRNRFGPWTNSGYRFATLAQTAPWVMGLTFEPLTETTASPATVTLRLHVSGQSSGQTLARSTFTMAYSSMRRCQTNPTRRGLIEPAGGGPSIAPVIPLLHSKAPTHKHYSPGPGTTELNASAYFHDASLAP